MSFYEFEGKRPCADPEAFVHPQAVLIGDVIVEAGCYIGADFTRPVRLPGAYKKALEVTKTVAGRRSRGGLKRVSTKDQAKAEI